MDPTTLVTFLFRAPPEIRTVELLGSWDNFQQPYRMHHDSRRGIGFYSGCFSFVNIIFDGDVQLQWTKPRSGGLKQGGTYWYYYRLNYEFEAYDDRQPHTTGCPLLPGQEVNIIDVPTEVVELPSRCHSAYGDIIGTLTDFGMKQTMDPASKFAMLSPPPISKVHVRCSSDDALSGRLESQNFVLTESPEPPVLTAKPTSERPVSRRNVSREDHLQEEPASWSSSSRPCSPMEKSGTHAAFTDPFHIATPTCHGRPLTATSGSSIQQLCTYPRPAPAQRIFSEYTTPLSVVEEDRASDDITGRETEDVIPPFSDRDRRPSSSSNIFAPSSYNTQPDISLDSHEQPPLDRPRLYSLPKTDLHTSPPLSPLSSPSASTPGDSDHPTPSSSPSSPLHPLTTAVTLNPETIHSVDARLLLTLPLASSPPSLPQSHPLPQWERPQREPPRRDRLPPPTRTPTSLFTYSLPPQETDSTLSLAKTLSSARSREAMTMSNPAAPTTNLTATTACRAAGTPPKLELSTMMLSPTRLSIGLNCMTTWDGSVAGCKGVVATTPTTAAAAAADTAEAEMGRGTEDDVGRRISERAVEGRDGSDADDGPGRGRRREEEPSIAETILSELGYLGESIA